MYTAHCIQFQVNKENRIPVKLDFNSYISWTSSNWDTSAILYFEWTNLSFIISSTTKKLIVELEQFFKQVTPQDSKNNTTIISLNMTLKRLILSLTITSLLWIQILDACSPGSPGSQSKSGSQGSGSSSSSKTMRLKIPDHYRGKVHFMIWYARNSL